MRLRWARILILTLALCGASLAVAQTYRASRGLYTHGLWRVARSTSSHWHPKTLTDRICLNLEAPPAELWTCAGPVASPHDWATTQSVSCTDGDGRHRISVVWSNDGGVVTDRSDYQPSFGARQTLTRLPPAERKRFAPLLRSNWAASTMTAVGECPVAMRDDQALLVVKSDGKIVDPLRAAECMVSVLKTVDGVTDAKSGYVRDPTLGLLPFVRYTYPSRDDRRPTVVTFRASGEIVDDPTPVHFVTELSGLFAPGPDGSPIDGKGPDDFDFPKISKLWEDRCGVVSNAMFV